MCVGSENIKRCIKWRSGNRAVNANMPPGVSSAPRSGPFFHCRSALRPYFTSALRAPALPSAPRSTYYSHDRSALRYLSALRAPVEFPISAPRSSYISLKSNSSFSTSLFRSPSGSLYKNSSFLWNMVEQHLFTCFPPMRQHLYLSSCLRLWVFFLCSVFMLLSLFYVFCSICRYIPKRCVTVGVCLFLSLKSSCRLISCWVLSLVKTIIKK